MSDLYVVAPDRIVFIFSACADGTWKFSRLSPHHKQKFVMVYGEKHYEQSWVVQDQSPGQRGVLFGFPDTPTAQDRSRPPVGSWKIWGVQFHVTNRMPSYGAIASPFELKLPFGTMRYTEAANVGRLDVELTSGAITDDDLERGLNQFKKVIYNLARRPRMVLLLCSDGRTAAIPSWRHIRRLLAFIDENGTELVLVGRGHAIILQPGIIGSLLIGTVKMVQKMVPPPWLEVIVGSHEEAETFLAKLSEKSEKDAVNEAAETRPSASPELPSLATPLAAGLHDEAKVLTLSREALAAASTARQEYPDTTAMAPLLAAPREEAQPPLREQPLTLTAPFEPQFPFVGKSWHASTDELPVINGRVLPEIFKGAALDLVETQMVRGPRGSWWCSCDCAK